MKHDLFSTPVWHIKGAPQQLVDELYKGAYKFKEIYKGVENRTNQGGYQTPYLEWKDFHPQGIEYINKVVGDIFKFQVKEWWYNINPKSTWNLPHTHPNCDMALVFYVTDSDSLLQLINPHSMRVNNEHYNSIDAKKGDIIMFPSDIMHFVMPNFREKDRISISMNLQLC